MVTLSPVGNNGENFDQFVGDRRESDRSELRSRFSQESIESPPVEVRSQFSDPVSVMTVWPSGDLSIGRPPRRPEPELEDFSEGAPVPYYTDPITLERRQLAPWTESEIDKMADYISALWAEGRTHEAGILLEKLSRETQKTTGLSGVLNSHKTCINELQATEERKRRPRGSGGITGYGKKMLRSAAAIFEGRYDRRVVTFSTLTVPRLTEEENLMICENWSELTRQMLQELRRELNRNDLPDSIFGCSEIQPQRWEKSREVAPHLHFCYVGRLSRKGAWLVDKNWMRETWARLLENLVGHEIEKSALTQVNGVIKSLKAELGKYLSKGGKIIQEIVDEGRGSELPKAYWNCSMELKREIKEGIAKIHGVAASLWMKNREALKDAGIANLREVWTSYFCPKAGKEVSYVIGVSGWVSVSDWGDFVSEDPDELERKLNYFRNRYQ